MIKSTAAAPWNGIPGARAMVANTTKVPVAPATNTQSNQLREGVLSHTTCIPSMRAST